MQGSLAAGGLVVLVLVPGFAGSAKEALRGAGLAFSSVSEAV